jgi:hypothetical protein
VSWLWAPPNTIDIMCQQCSLWRATGRTSLLFPMAGCRAMFSPAAKEMAYRADGKLGDGGSLRSRVRA